MKVRCYYHGMRRIYYNHQNTYIMRRNGLLIFFYLFVEITSGIAQSNYIEEIATITDNPTVFGIGLKGPYLYVNPGSSSIKIYDLSIPSSPKSVGHIAYSSDFAINLDVYGNYLYIYGGPSNNLRIFDISNPISPIEIGLLEFPPSGYGIWHAAHLSNYSYMTAKDSIYIINTLDKSAPFIENKIIYSEGDVYGLRDIFATSEFLYIGVGDGILIYDNTSLSLPVFHSIYPNGRLNLAVDITAHRLFTAQSWSSNYRHYVSDISDPFVPNLIYQGTGGSSPGQLLFNNGILIQAGSDTGNQAVSFYKIETENSIFIEEFLGSIEYSITDMDAVGSSYIIAKNGGIEILKYNDSIPELPSIFVIPDAISFENTNIGEIVTEIIMVSNVGPVKLEITDISSSIDVFAVDLTSFTIEPGKTQELTVTFAPDEQMMFEDALQIESNDPQGTFEVPLSGYGNLYTHKGNEISTEHVQIFPNPINNMLFVKHVNGDEISIYDSFGNLKLSRIGKSEIEQVDVSTLPTGTYMIRIISKEGMITKKKIVVIR